MLGVLPLVLTFAQAQPTPAAPEPSAADLAEIQRAMAADQAAQKAAAPAAPASAAPDAAANAGGAAASLNPDLSLIGDFAAAAFSADQPLQGGDHDPHRNGFNLQQLELSAHKAVDPYFRFDANIVFSLGGVEIEEAYATTVSLPYSLQLRGGQFLTRFGRLNSTHPHAWDFADQPFVLTRLFGGEGNRGLGVEASWLAPLPWYLELVGSFTDAAGEDTARSFLGATQTRVTSPLDLQATVAAKQFFPLSDDLSLSWGLSGALGPNPSGPDARTNIFGTDLYLKFRPITYGSHTIVSLQAELFHRRREVPGDLLKDTGGYAYLFWRFAQRWAAALRYEDGSPSTNRSGAVVVDDLDPFWTAHRQRVSAAVTFWPTEFSRLRLQGSSDRLGWERKTNWALFLTAEFVVGAHGAHVF